MEILLSVSIAMFVALLFTRVFKLIKLPNVTAYLIAGVVIGPYVLNLVNSNSLSALNSITIVALGFIAFSIGAEFKI